MFGWLKTWLEIARLRAESKRLAREIEQTSRQPVRLSRQELQQLAESANEIGPEMIRKQSSLHPDDVELLIELIQPDENR